MCLYAVIPRLLQRCRWVYIRWWGSQPMRWAGQTWRDCGRKLCRNAFRDIFTLASEASNPPKSPTSPPFTVRITRDGHSTPSTPLAARRNSARVLLGLYLPDPLPVHRARRATERRFLPLQHPRSCFTNMLLPGLLHGSGPYTIKLAGQGTAERE